MNNGFPTKLRKKYIEVPLHKAQRDNHEVPRMKKTYSANFTSKNHREKHGSHNILEQKCSEVIIELPEKDSDIGKKNVYKEIERLNKNNEDIAAKFNELEDLSVKKILKLKEKVNNLQNLNLELNKDIDYIKNQYYDLAKYYENVKSQLELRKICKNCEGFRENVTKVIDENDVLRKQNSEVKEDLNMMKTVVFRLNVQLERYQEKLRKYNISINKYSHLQSQKPSTSQPHADESINILSSDHQNHRHTPISWGSVNSHALAPLLGAYQDTINEKDKIIQDHELEIAKFTGTMREIMKENENIYEKLTEDESCSIKLEGQLKNMKVELKIIKDQNDTLIKKCATKQDKIEEILKVYANKVDQMKRDYQVIHDEYIKLRNENASLKDKIKPLTESQDDYDNERQNYIPISVHTASINECKKCCEELKLQYENENSTLKETIETQKKTIHDLNNTLTSLKRSKEELEAKTILLEKELQRNEAKHVDLEHSLNQVKVSRSACRKQLHKAMCFAKDMVTEQEILLKALNQRQLENKAVKKIGSEMAVKMDSLKIQLKDVQKSAWQEFSTVEQKIQVQADLITTMEEDHQKEIEKLQNIIVKQEEKFLKHKKGYNVPLSHYHVFKEKYT